MLLRICSPILLLCFPTPLWAFPEMVRHGYVNCTTCHVSPSGGGVLTQYGRELSKEVLSTWGREGEAAFFYKVHPPDWLNLGGDLRTIQIYKDSPTAVSGRFILMQADLETAATFKKFTLDATFGYTDRGASQSWLDQFISRRHFVKYQATDEISLRSGKFFYSYGINTPDHVTSIRRGLQINDEGTESYNLEWAYLGESLNILATGIFGRPDDQSLNNKREKGFALNASVAPGAGYKIGASYLRASTAFSDRHVFGPYGILGFTPHFFLLAELDWQGAVQSGAQRQWGFGSYNRLDYEFFQGFHTYLSQEFLKRDLKNPDTISKAYGIGIQFFPRPHFEFNLSWQIQTQTNVEGYTDYAVFLCHFYP